MLFLWFNRCWEFNPWFLCLRLKLHGISLEVLGCLKLSIGTFCHRQGLFGVLSTKPPMPQPRMHSSTFVQVKPSLLCLYYSKSGEKASSTLVPPGQTSPLTSLSLMFLCYRMCRRNQSLNSRMLWESKELCEHLHKWKMVMSWLQLAVGDWSLFSHQANNGTLFTVWIITYKAHDHHGRKRLHHNPPWQPQRHKHTQILHSLKY